MRTSVFAQIVLVVVASGLFVVAAGVSYVSAPAVHVPFEPEKTIPGDVLQGFYPTEVTPQGTRFDWTNGHARVVLGEVDRRTSWRVRMRLASGAWPPSASAPSATFDVDGVAERTEVLPADFTDYDLVIPARPGRRGVTIGIQSPTFVPGAQDTRQLGITIQELSLRPDGVVRPSPRWLLAAAGTGALLSVSFGIMSIGPAWLLATMMSLGLAYGWLLRLGAAASVPYVVAPWKVALWIAGLTVLVIGSGRLARRRFSPQARLALALTGAGMFVKLLLIFHPDMIVGDTIFHLHRFQRVVAGNYFFTSAAPGGEFPYPVALYVVASWWRWTTDNWVVLLRTIVAIADAAAGVAVYRLAALSSGTLTAGLWALAFYHLTPAVFQVHGTAYLTNAFGQAISVVALFGVCVLSDDRALTWRFAGTTLVILVALLSHMSTAAILGGVLMVACLLLALTNAPRRVTRTILLASALAAGLSTVIYYGHFTDTYRTMLTRTAAPISVDRAVPEQKPEAHQTGWAPGWAPFAARAGAVPGYLQKYLGWSLLVMATLGGFVLASNRPTARPTLLLAAWVVTCVLFLAMGLLTPVDMRYYLAVAPALAILAGVGVQWGMQRAWPTKVAVVTLVTWFVASGLNYWAAWLRAAPPR